METKKTERDGPLKNIKIKIIIICGDWNNLLADYWSMSNVWNLHSNKKRVRILRMFYWGSEKSEVFTFFTARFQF